MSERRDKIMHAAITCFLEKGFHQSSIRNIAKEANISLGNFYNHFQSKSELIEELASYEAKELAWMETLANKNKDAKKRLEEFTKRYLAHVERKENIILSVEVLAEAMRNPAIGKHYLKNRQTVSESLVKILNAGIEAKQFTPTLDTQEVAELIQDMIEGVAMRYVLSHKANSKATIQTLQSMILRLVSQP